MGIIEIELPPLYPLQEVIAKKKARFKVLACGRRFGKCLSINTEIPTIEGFKTMGDIKIGDIVFGEDGKQTNVTFVSDIYYDHPCYEITFTDNTKIIADNNHQWLTYTKLNRKSINRNFKNSQKPTVKTTDEIANSLYHGKEINHTIPLCKPIEYNTQDLLIDPYILGLWLGDGASKDAVISAQKSDMEFYEKYFNKNNFELHYMSKYDYRIVSYNDKPKYNLFRRKLKELNLIKNKHIPEIYLISDIEQRLELLRGLMDTDGTYSSNNNHCEFYTMKKLLAIQVYTLITSLGIRATIGEKEVKIKNKSYGICYRVNFTSRDINVFKLPRKANNQNIDNREKWFSKHRGIKEIKKIDSIPVRCISVDNRSHLYLVTRSFIATHNTRLCSNIAFQNAINGKKVWWVGPVYSVSMIGWRLVLSLVHQLPKDLGISVNIADKTITFPGGGFISFKSADHPENLRGEGLDLLIMDEADFCKEAVWTEVLRPSLADRKGSAIFISTPYKEGGWFHKLYLSGYPGNPRLWQRFKNTPFPYYNEPLSQNKEVLSFQFSSYCNPFIDPEEINNAEKTSTNIVFEREFLAHFVSAAGARVKKEWIKTVNVIPEKINVAIGADLAISQKTTADYTAISVLCQERKTGNIIIGEIKRGRWTFQEQQNEILNMATKWSQIDPFLKIGIEDNQYQKVLVQEISRLSKFAVIGVHATTDKISRFASLESKYQHGQIYHMHDLPIEFEAELLSFPVGEHDDMVDSLYDAYYCFDPVTNEGIVKPVALNSNTVFRHTKRERF